AATPAAPAPERAGTPAPAAPATTAPGPERAGTSATASAPDSAGIAASASDTARRRAAVASPVGGVPGSHPGPGRSGPRLGWRWNLAAALVVTGLLAIGSRDVLGQALPVVGQLPSATGGVADWWHEWWSGAGTGGLVSPSYSPPGALVMAILGVISLGSAGFALHLLVFAPLLLGPLGVYVGARAFGSDRGRLAASALYAAVPVPFNAIAQGHLSGLVSYAAAPWLITAVSSLGGQAPYTFWAWGAVWPRFVAFGLGLALAAAMAPALLAVVAVIGAAMALATLLVSRDLGGSRLFVASLLIGAVAAVSLGPWALLGLRSWPAFLSVPAGGAPSGVSSVSQLLRLQSGPYGAGALAWALVAAAAIPLFIGRSWRLAWAARMWFVAAACMGLVWAGSQGRLVVPPAEVLLAPAAAALVFAVALGAAAVEVDLSGYRFGWRQFAPAFGLAAALTAVVPFLTWVGNGQWDLPSSGAEEAFPFPGTAGGDYRVLWLGSASLLPLSPQGRAGALSFGTSLDGLPLAAQLWGALGSAQSNVVAQDLSWAGSNQTTQLGHLLAPFSVRYVVVPVGEQSRAGTTGAGATGAAVTGSLTEATMSLLTVLSRQTDLVPVGLDPGYQVFANTVWLPVFSLLGSNASAAQLAGAVANSDRAAGASALQQLAPGRTAPLGVGTAGRAEFGVLTAAAADVVYASVLPGTWELSDDGHPLPARTVGAVATSWSLPAGKTTVVVARSGAAAQHAADLLLVLLWLVALLLARRSLRRGARLPFTLANLELGSPSTEVLEIDWSSVLEGHSIG
ncbi:MAG TPA: hypothetical protein VME46_06700, partial [Acidimicrobiales bacterium]|nr:hypothetical protein [Acidimicrobiales bacterium]